MCVKLHELVERTASSYAVGKSKWPLECYTVVPVDWTPAPGSGPPLSTGATWPACRLADPVPPIAPGCSHSGLAEEGAQGWSPLLASSERKRRGGH